MTEVKKHIFIFFLFSAVSMAFSQESLPIYQQYLLDGKYLINPAHYGETDDVVLNGNYQKQFTNFDESPNVQSVGIHANVVDRLGAGVAFFRDQNGPYSANGITVGASYFIPLSDDERKDQFSFGANANFYNMNIDFSKLVYEDAGDPVLAEGKNNIFLVYTNLGLQATYRNFFAGISVLDIPLSNDTAFVNGIEPLPTKYLLNSGYDWQFTEGLSLEPSILLNLNSNSSKMVDINLIGKVFNEQSMFGAGVSYRTAIDKNGNQQLSLSPIIKARLDKLTFGASYSFGLSDIATYGGNSFMLSLGYNFENFINGRGFRNR